MGQEKTSNRRRRLKAHACKRARERWNIRLTLEDISGLNAVVRLGLGRPMERNSKKPGEKYFVTTLCGTQIPVVYDHRYKTIVTVLDAHAPEVRRAMARRNIKSDSGPPNARPPKFAASLDSPGVDAPSVSASAPGSSLQSNGDNRV